MPLWLPGDRLINPVEVRLRRANTQTINTAASTDISWDTADLNVPSFVVVHATTGTVLTVPAGAGGLWMWTCTVDASAAFTTRGLLAAITNIGGVTWQYRSQMTAEDIGTLTMTERMAPADTLTWSIYQQSGTSKTITAKVVGVRIAA